MLMIASVLFAQNKPIKIGKYQLTDVTITSGKGALTSGLDTRFDFKDDKSHVLFIQANSDRVTVNYGKAWKHFKLIGSFGVFKNMPWCGPMLIFNFGPVDITAWNGIVLSKDPSLTEFGYHPQFFISYEGAGLTFCKNNRIGGAVLWFGQQPMNWFLSYKRTINIGEKSKIFAEVTYNHALNNPMFVVGYNIKFQ